MNTFRKKTTVACFALLVGALGGSSGCGMKASDWKPSKLFSLDNAWPFGNDELEEGMPVRVVGAWTDTVLNKSGQKPQRGFGGRLAFYGAESDKSILVDGQLVVYAFEEVGREPTDNKPTRRYVFPADQMQHHMSESELGATYSFWLPWDEAGGPKTEVSLICRFEPNGGAVVTSEQTRHLLPGSMPAASAITGVAAATGPTLPEGEPSRPARPTLESVRADHRRDNATQMASFESAGAPHIATTAGGNDGTADLPARQMGVTTIALPDNFQPHDVAAAMRSNVPGNQPTNQPTQHGQQMMPASPQQPAAGTMPAMQPSTPPTMNRAYMVPQSTTLQLGGMAAAYTQQQVNMRTMPAGTYSPAFNSAAMPMASPQPIYGAQPMTMQPGTTMMSPQMANAAMQPAMAGQSPAIHPMQPQQTGQQMQVQQGTHAGVSYPQVGAFPQLPAR